MLIFVYNLPVVDGESILGVVFVNVSTETEGDVYSVLENRSYVL